MPTRRLSLAVIVALALTTTRGDVSAGTATRASGSLSVWTAGAWRTWWRSDQAPARWAAPDSTVTRAVAWQRLDRGLEWATLGLACAGPAWRTRLIVARLDPRAVSLAVVMDLNRTDARPAWTIDRAPDDAVLAMNAGQFVETMPWGWVVMDGTQRLSPGIGPLSSFVAIDRAGRVRWSHGEPFPAEGVVSGFQSYPTLLVDGTIPPALRAPGGGGGVSLRHRDARLAIGRTRDDKLLVVMTRFDVLGDAAGGFPLGPTTPEMAAIMGALGATDAVMLDGGISAQLLLRGPGREPLTWRGIRKVPLALIARPRVLAGAAIR